MGANASRPIELDAAIARTLTSQTHFSEEEIQALASAYFGATNRTNQMNLNQFREALRLEDDIFSERLFGIICQRDDRRVSFVEFVKGLSVFAPSAPESEKILISFRLYDSDASGCIEVDELYTMLSAAARSHYPDMTESQIRQMTEAAIAQLDKDGNGKLDYEEYAEAARTQSLLSSMTISVLPTSAKKAHKS